MQATMIEIQEEFAAKINDAFARWQHTKKEKWQICGGHYHRIARGAYRSAEKKLKKLGFNEQQIRQIIIDAREWAELERNAE